MNSLGYNPETCGKTITPPWLGDQHKKHLDNAINRLAEGIPPENETIDSRMLESLALQCAAIPAEMLTIKSRVNGIIDTMQDAPAFRKNIKASRERNPVQAEFRKRMRHEETEKGRLAATGEVPDLNAFREEKRRTNFVNKLMSEDPVDFFFDDMPYWIRHPEDCDLVAMRNEIINSKMPSLAMIILSKYNIPLTTDEIRFMIANMRPGVDLLGEVLEDAEKTFGYKLIGDEIQRLKAEIEKTGNQELLDEFMMQEPVLEAQEQK